MRIGRKRIEAALHDRVLDRQSQLALLVGELDDEHAGVDLDADQEDHAHFRLHVQRRAGEEQHEDHADQAQRHRDT